MPVKLERELKRRVADKDWSDEKKDAYVYGTLRKTGWKPKRERNKELHSKLDNLIEFKEEDRRYNPGAGTIGGVVAPIATVGVTGVATREAIGTGGDKEIRKADLPLMQKLNIEANKAGAEVFESKHEGVPAVAYRKQKGVFGKASKQQMKMITGEENLPSKAVAIGPAVRKEFKPGILAHEIGHIKQPAWMVKPWTRIAGQFGPLGTAVYGASTSDEKRAQIAAGAGVASAGPMLVSEVDASLRGKRLLEKHGVKGGRRFSPGIGLASYGAVAALPAVAYGTKKVLGGYKPKEKQLSSKLDNIIEFQPRESRRDPEERLRDRLEILSKITGTAAGLGLLGAAGYGVHTIHKHGKGLLQETRKAAQAMGRAGEAIEHLDIKTDEPHRIAVQLRKAIEQGNATGESGDVVRGFRKAQQSAGWFGKLFRPKVRALEAKLDELIEFGIVSPAQVEQVFGRGGSLANLRKLAGGVERRAALAPGIARPSVMGGGAATGSGGAPNYVSDFMKSRTGVNPAVSAPVGGSGGMATGSGGASSFADMFSRRAGGNPGAVTPKPTAPAPVASPAALPADASPAASKIPHPLLIGAAGGLAAGGVGGYLLAPRRQQSQYADSSLLIQFERGKYIVKRSPFFSDPEVSEKAKALWLKIAKAGPGKSQLRNKARSILAVTGKRTFLESKLDDLIEMGNDPRPRDNLGQFAPPGEGGPDRNAMAITYAPPQPEKKSALGPGALATAGIAGAAGEGGAIAFRKVLEKVKAAKLKKA